MIVKENEYSTSLYNTGEELCNCTNRFKLKKKKERKQIKVHVVKTSNEGNSHVVVLQTMVSAWLKYCMSDCSSSVSK